MKSTYNIPSKSRMHRNQTERRAKLVQPSKGFDNAAVLIPAYNEEKYIGKVVSESKKVLKNVIVIDDGSKDKTAKIAKKHGAVVIKHKKNKGKGVALNTGFKYIQKHKKIKYFVIVDADLQYLPKEIPIILKPLETGKVDFVMGKRNWKTVPFRHWLGNFVWRAFFNILFGSKLKDTNCGFMGISKKALHKMGNMHGGYIIENYFLVKALKAGLRISQPEVTVHYHIISNVPRGIRMVLGILIFILKEGIDRRLKL